MTDLSTYVFALDLTSVCVSTGIVQLPMKMQPFFEDGEIDATVDGEDVRLEFAGPRRLGGFKAHFEKRGLNANDKIRFELKCEDSKATEILAACVKRERSKPAEQSRLSAEDEAERRGASSKPPESDGQVASADRVDGSWSETGSTVRAVRKVTIVGSDMLPALESNQSNHASIGYAKNSSAPPAPGSSRLTTWQALDGLSREDTDEHASAVEYADTTVRAVRRRANHLRPANDDSEASTLVNRATEANVSRHDGVERADDAVAQTATMRLSDLVAPAEKQRQETGQRGRPAPVRARIFAGRGPRAVQSTFSGATARTPTQEERPTAKSPDLEPIAERELVPVARASAAVSRSSAAPMLSTTGDVAPTKDSFLRSSAIAGGLFGTADSPVDQPSHVVEQQDSSGFVRNTPPAVETRPLSVTMASTSTNGASALIIDDADFGGEYAAPERKVGQEGAVEPEMKDAPERLEPTPTLSPAVTTSEAASQNDLGHDLSLVTRLLDRPDVPAIVRSDVVAERLGLTAERCERALERLSEDRDRVSRIRKGAYMIRRDATKRVAE